MNTNTKRNTAITATIEGDAIQLVFANGETLVMRASALNDDIRIAATMHGLKQKLVDAAAISRNPDTGRSATVADKFEAVRAVYDRLLAGQWNATRGEGGGASGGLLFRALCRMYAGKPQETIREFLDGKTDAEKAALRKNPRIAAIIETLKAERAPDTGMDTDALLGELEGDD